MATNAFIDLSLSTDDEAHSESLPSPKHFDSKSHQLTSGFFNLSDDFSTIARFDQECPDQPSKKRRLSPLVADGGYTTTSNTTLIQKTASVKSRPAVNGKSGHAKISLLDSDSISFTSSPHAAPKLSKRPRDSQSARRNRSDCDDLADDISKAATLPPVKETQLSNRTAALLANISNNARPRNKTTLGSAKYKSDERIAAKRTSSANRAAIECEKQRAPAPAPPITSSSLDQVNAVKRTRLSSVKRHAREQDRQLAKIRKDEEREEEKEKRRQLKEEKAREKKVAADLAEVNKARTDKKTSTPEMIVDLPASVKGKSVETQTVAFLKGLNVRITTYDSPMPDIIKWRRKVTASFNEEQGHWEPVPEVICDEKHVMCLLSAKDFVSMASTDPIAKDGLTLEAHVLELKEAFPNRTYIFLIEGLECLMRKSKNAKNRAYQAEVLNQLDSGSNSVQATASRRKNITQDIANEDLVEDALLRLQVIYGCLFHHTDATVQTAEWISKFTQHISTIPYRYVRASNFY